MLFSFTLRISGSHLSIFQNCLTLFPVFLIRLLSQGLAKDFGEGLSKGNNNAKMTSTPPNPPLELVVEVAPLAIEVASPVIPEAQSPTLKIQGVLGKLILEEEAS